MIYRENINKFVRRITLAEKITAKDLYEIIYRIRDVMKENEKYLTDLDAAIGDADHGVNMVRGFNLATERLKDIDPNNTDVGTVLQTAGMAILETVGGAAGPLYGMWFTQMGMTAGNIKEIDKETLAKLLETGLETVKTTGGGTQVGDKTMVDALEPAVNALKEAVGNPNNSLVEALEKAVKAAEEGMKSTIPLIAKKGRASYLGERSKGHQDPGATSTYLILKTIYEYVKSK